MRNGKILVGIVGANPERGWGTLAHIPALKALPDFELAAVATTRRETAEATARRFGIPLAFGDWREMLARPDLDLVAVCVKVEFHREIVLAALAAGKHVFCEWPLGLDAAEAQEMLDAAERAGVSHTIGLQGRVSPVLGHARHIVEGGGIGRVISTTLVSSLSNWSPRLPPAEAYRIDKSRGATALTVPGGHSIDSLCYCLGEFEEFSARSVTQYREAIVIGTGETLEVTAPDQVLVVGRLAGGAAAMVHIKANVANPTGVRFEINGTDGDLVLTTRPPVGPSPVGMQRADLVLRQASGIGTEFVEVEIPDRYRLVPAGMPGGPPFFTAQIYARLADALRNGAAFPASFKDAVRRHRTLEAIQRASDTGQAQRLAD